MCIINRHHVTLVLSLLLIHAFTKYKLHLMHMQSAICLDTEILGKIRRNDLTGTKDLKKRVRTNEAKCVDFFQVIYSTGRKM